MSPTPATPAGLAGVVAGASAISHQDPAAERLTYRGYSVVELAERCDFEQVVHLLLYGELADRSRLERLCARERELRSLDIRERAVLDVCPLDMPPLRVMSAVLSVGEEAPSDDPRAGALALVGALAVRAALAAYFDVPDTARVIAFTLSAVALIAYDASLRHAALAPSLTQARLMALNSRIRPHFLFNSLNAVLGILRSDPRRAETALEELAELYRVLMRDHDGLVRLSDEIALGRRYLDLEKLRLGERLRVDWEIDAVPPDARVPPLLLQPLLENAVYHGVEPSSAPALVRVGLRRAAGQIEIEISNPYHGEAAHGGGQHMAVANIRERLRLYFDLAGTLAQDVRAGRYRVQLRFPYTIGSDDDE